MNRLTSICLILLCFFTGSALAKDDGWRLDKDDDGIQIYTRAVEGSAYREIRAKTHVQGRLSSVVALLQDMSFMPKLNKIIASAQVYEEISETEVLQYLEMDMPWPVTDRDVLNRRQIWQEADSKVVTITGVATRDILPEKKGYVRIVQSSQRWTLIPNAQGSVAVEWTTHTDPNGPIPATIVNMLSVGAPYDSLTVLREAIEGGEYADARLSYIAEP